MTITHAYVQAAWMPPEGYPEFGGHFRLVNEDGSLGDLAVRVNAAPEHSRHDGHWFEAYKGAAADYVHTRDAEDCEAGYIDRVSAQEDYAARQRPLDEANRERVNADLDELVAEARVELVGDALQTRLAQLEGARP